jgi:hypothetical protein
MRRDLKNRLFRAAAAANETSWADLQSAQHRSLLRARVKICDGISEALREKGVEPEGVSVWREEAAAELANIPDTPELRAADEAILSRARSEKADTGALERIMKRLERMRAAPPGKHFAP